ncbi:MAG: hypothetical protein ACRC3Z_06335 [Phocaeicola sp.]
MLVAPCYHGSAAPTLSATCSATPLFVAPCYRGWAAPALSATCWAAPALPTITLLC